MKIVIVSETFARHMGYIQNALPKALAAEGHEVHLITTALPPNYSIAGFQESYATFLHGHAAGDVESLDGYNVHYVPHELRLGYLRMPTLREMLRRLQPDVVQLLHVIGWMPLDAAVASLAQPFGLFSAAHYTRSVFPLAQREIAPWDVELIRARLTRSLPGRLVSWRTARCYAATPDCADVAIRFFGVQQKKVDIVPLGVDTELFRPPTSNERASARRAIRERFEIGEDALLLLYTGRFTDGKNPVVLANAVEQLRARGQKVTALFVGDGPQRDRLAATNGCQVTDFVPNQALPEFFWASDIGVWPTQESLSMLDAAASGLPIIVNHTIEARERYEGNGRVYHLGDSGDLAAVVESLRDPVLRASLGEAGATKMRELFSWQRMARRRLQDYARFARRAT